MLKKICYAVMFFTISIFCLSFSYKKEKEQNIAYHHILTEALKNNRSGIISDDESITIINGTDTNVDDLIDKKNNKCYFIYNLGKVDENSKYKNGNIMLYDYTQNVPKSIVIVLSQTELHNLPNDLNDYFDYVLSHNSVTRNDVLKMALANDSEESYFNLLWDQEYTFRFTPYGYISIMLNVYKHEGPSSDLFLANFDVSFVPGTVAVANDDSIFEKYMINSGYFHIEAQQAVEDLGPNQKRLGGIPYFKDSYPSSSTGVVSITSSVNTSYTFGYSFTNGFSTSSGFSVQGDKTYGNSIDFGYSKTLTISDPIVSSQPSSTNSKEYQWSFVSNSDIIRKTTFSFNCGYIFELDERRSQTYDDAMALKTNFKMEFEKDTIWPWGHNKNTQTGFNTFMYP